MTKPARKEPIRADLGTPERRAKGDIGVVGVGKSDKRAKAISKLEAMRLRRDIDDVQLAAGLKLALHRHYGKQTGLPKSPSLDRVDSFGGGSTGLTAEDHANSYHEAVKLIAGRGITPFLAFVLDDDAIEDCAKMLGNRRLQRNLKEFHEIVVHNLDILAIHWGLTSEVKSGTNG